MASSSSIRALILSTVSVLTASTLPCSATAETPRGWYDQQLNYARAALEQHLYGGSRRDTIIAIASLDRVYSLREQVRSAATIDEIIHRVASTPNLSPEIAAEAANLDSRIASHNGAQPALRIEKPAEDNSIDELLRWAEAQSDPSANVQSADAEIQDAAAEITFFHRRIRPGLIESAARSSGSAQAWYRFAQSVTDDSQRSAALHRSLELDSSYLPAALETARRHSAQGQLARARQILESCLRQYPDDPFVSSQLAQLDINGGQAGEALALLRPLTRKDLPIAAARDVAEIYLQLGFLSEARELAHRAFNQHRDGIEEREMILRIDKQSDNVRALREDHALFASANANLTAVTHLPSAESTGADANEDRDPQSQGVLDLLHGRIANEKRPDSEYLVDVSEAQTRWRSMPASMRMESRLLADVRIEKLRGDYQGIQHFQQLIAVGSAADVGSYSQKAIQYSPDSQQLAIQKARIHRVNGRTTEGEDLGETSVAEPSVAMYYDLRAHQYRFPDLRAGDVIELEYTISPLSSKNPYGNYFAQIVAFGSALPTDVQRYVLCAPDSLNLKSAEHMVPPAIVHHEGDQMISIWEKKNIAGLELEDHAPSWSEQGAYIHISNFESWEALGRWYAGMIAPQFKLDRDLETVVSEIVDRHPNRLDRIAAIDEMVLTSTRYVALEFGVYGLKPYPVSQTFSRKFGDCKDKASLMVALLRGAGIDADLALVRTRHLGSFVEKPASVSMFDHAIVYVPEFDLWLDGTAEFSRLRELPVQDQGVMALTIDSKGEAVLRKTPVSSAADNFSRRTIDATIEADGQIHFSGATYIRGDDAPELRRELDPRDGKISYIRDRLAQVLPAVEVRHVETPQAYPDAVALSFSGDLSIFQGKSSATLPSSWMRRDYVSTLAQSGARSQDLLLDAPWTTEEEIHIQIPARARATQLPHDQMIETEFGKASLTYSIKDREITIFSHVEFDQTRITVSQYNAFRDFTVQLEDTFHRNITVELR